MSILDEHILVEKIDSLTRRVSTLEKLLGQTISQEKARRILGISRTTIKKYREKGYLPFSKINNQIRISISDVNNLLSQLKK